MKLTKNRSIVALAGLFGLGALTLAAPANAQSTSRADAIKDVRRAEAQVQRERRDLYRADTPSERRDALKDLRNAEDHLRDEQRDLARFGGYRNYGQYERYNNYGQYRRYNTYGWTHRRDWR
jgi:hypothetical protein